MDNRKFEKLIDLIINENEDKARELFHQIVVEKSREIYESIMDEEMMADEGDDGMGGQVGQLMDEITAEESGVMEDDEEAEGEEEVEYDFSDDEESEEESDESDEDLADEVHDLEDRVVSIEDKLDDLLAQFEAEMGGEEEMGDEEEGEEEAMMEAVELQKVAVTHGDDGAYTKSPTAFNSGKAGMDSKPVNFSGGGQENGRKAPATKDVEGASSFKNAPGHKSQDLDKAPAATKSQASGVNTKSPVAHK